MMDDGIIRDVTTIQILRKESPKSKVIDVGGGQDSFKKYFAKFEMTVLNIDDVPGTKATKFVRASITDNPFKDGEFDIVTCLDTLEHIPRKYRKKAVTEMIRISKKKVILAVPCGRLSKFFEAIVLGLMQIFKRNTRWLAEHEKEGLPMPDEIKYYIKSSKQGKLTKVIDSNNVFLWFFMSLLSPLIRNTVRKSDRNKLSKGFSWVNLFNFWPGYRKVFIIEKT